MIDPYIGEVTCFAFNFAPVGWFACDGRLLSAQEYSQLFSVIGKTYGGDGVAAFALPNFPQTMTPDGGQLCIAAFGVTPPDRRHALPGEMTMFANQKGPAAGWIECRGDRLQTAKYASLFKILGKKFGGNGVTTFDLPESKYVPPPFGSGSPPLPYSITEMPCGSPAEGLTGEIKIFPATVPPHGWLPCDGRVLSIGSPNTALFTLLTTTYGGDGKTTFGLPNITMPVAVQGLQAFICQLGVYPGRP